MQLIGYSRDALLDIDHALSGVPCCIRIETPTQEGKEA
jgi:hypothetical protein